MNRHILGLTRSEVERFIVSNFGEKSSMQRAARIFEGLYARASGIHWPPRFPDEAHKGTLEQLQCSFGFQMPVQVSRCEHSAVDGSSKLVLTLGDGLEIETVLIPERGRLTQCLSTQVGCAQGCRFCQTGRMGLIRSLTVAEIVSQVMAADIWRHAHGGVLSQYPRISNLVFMGMGEPLDNLDAVMSAVDIFTDTQGLQFSHNKITVSTVGLLPQLSKFLAASKACLALSLHSPFEDERSRVMPVNSRHPIGKVIEVLKEESSRYARPFMIQYTLLKNVNDSEVHAQALAELLSGLRVKINLIPLNEHDGAAFRRPELARVWKFRDVLKAAGHVATVRLSKGRDIAAACGQLIKK